MHKFQQQMWYTCIHGIRGGKLKKYLLYSFLSFISFSTWIINSLWFWFNYSALGFCLSSQISGEKIIKRYSTYIIHTTNLIWKDHVYMRLVRLGQTKGQSKNGWGPGVKNLGHRRTISSSIKEATSHFGSKRRGKQQLCFLTWYQKSLTTDILFLWHF